MGWIFQSSKMGVMDVPDGFRGALRFLSLWEFLVKTLGLEEKGRCYDGSRAASTSTSPLVNGLMGMIPLSHKFTEGMAGYDRHSGYDRDRSISYKAL